MTDLERLAAVVAAAVEAAGDEGADDYSVTVRGCEDGIVLRIEVAYHDPEEYDERPEYRRYEARETSTVPWGRLEASADPRRSIEYDVRHLCEAARAARSRTLGRTLRVVS